MIQLARKQISSIRRIYYFWLKRQLPKESEASFPIAWWNKKPWRMCMLSCFLWAKPAINSKSRMKAILKPSPLPSTISFVSAMTWWFPATAYRKRATVNGQAHTAIEMKSPAMCGWQETSSLWSSTLTFSKFCHPLQIDPYFNAQPWYNHELLDYSTKSLLKSSLNLRDYCPKNLDGGNSRPSNHSIPLWFLFADDKFERSFRILKFHALLRGYTPVIGDYFVLVLWLKFGSDEKVNIIDILCFVFSK